MSFSSEQVRDAVERLKAVNIPAIDGHYRFPVHPDSTIGRALAAGATHAEIFERYGVRIESEPVQELTPHAVAGIREAVAQHMGLEGMRQKAEPDPFAARAARAQLKRWRSPSRKRG